MESYFIVLNTLNMTMYEKELELDGSQDDTFILIAGIQSENDRFLIYTTLMTADLQENYKYLFGNLDAFKSTFPDWKEFFLGQENKVVYYSKYRLGGYIVRRV